MQAKDDEGDRSSAGTDDTGACGVLEDPDRVDIIRSGAVLAHMAGPERPESAAQGVYSKDRFEARIYYYERMYWRLSSALLMLQGASVQQVLGDEWIVLKGKSTDAWDPQPGFCNLVIANVVNNQGRLETQQLFLELRQALRL